MQTNGDLPNFDSQSFYCVFHQCHALKILEVVCSKLPSLIRNSFMQIIGKCLEHKQIVNILNAYGNVRLMTF